MDYWYGIICGLISNSDVRYSYEWHLGWLDGLTLRAALPNSQVRETHDKMLRTVELAERNLINNYEYTIELMEQLKDVYHPVLVLAYKVCKNGSGVVRC